MMLQPHQLSKSGQLNARGTGRALKLHDRPMRSGRPVTATTQENFNRAQNILMDDRRLTVNQIVNACCRYLPKMSREYSAQRTWHAQGFRLVGATALTPDQTHLRLVISQANLELYEADPASFLKRFLTKDEFWVHHFELETKRQSMHAVEAPPSPPAIKKANVVLSAMKVMTSVFCDAKGIVFMDYLQKGQTINGDMPHC